MIALAGPTAWAAWRCDSPGMLLLLPAIGGALSGAGLVAVRSKPLGQRPSGGLWLRGAAIGGLGWLIGIIVFLGHCIPQD